MFATFVVNNLADSVVENPNQFPGSLRQAVFDANANPGADTIVFEGFASSGTLTLTEGALQVTESVDIVGPGQSELTVSGGNNSGIFWFGDEVGASDFSVSELTLSDGNGVTGAPLSGDFGGSVLFFDQLGGGGEDSLNLTNVTIQNSTSNRGGGALHAALGTVNIVDSSFINNTATGTENGGGALSLQQTDTTLTRVTIAGNDSDGDGGGIINYVSEDTQAFGEANLTVIDSTIEGNSATFGGGIRNSTTTASVEANLTVEGTSISGNNTTGGLDGGGISSFAGVVTVSNSLVANNLGGTTGAGIFGENTELRIENSTISGNDSPNNTGGAIRLRANRASDPDGVGASTTDIVNSTLAFNNSGGFGALTSEARENSTSIVTVQNSIFSNNSGSPNFGTLGDGQSLFVSGGHNLFDDASGNLNQTGDQPNTDPLLVPLADNGGLTQTHALQIGSPAINAGSNSLAVEADGNPLATDQRGSGFDRVLDGNLDGNTIVDIGAFELAPFAGDLVVSTATDVVDSIFTSGELSLREAVRIANLRSGPDTITFDTALNGQTITLDGGVLQVTQSLDIVGQGASQLTVSGNDSSGIFWFGDEIGASTFSVSGLTLSDGNGVTGAPLSGNYGGAILFFDGLGAGGEDTLNLTDVTVQNSTSNRGGGALHAELGTLNIIDSSFINNTATDTQEGGGALSLQQTDSTLTRVTITGNDSDGVGGGIHNFVGENTPTLGDANLTVVDSTIDGNSANFGGGIFNRTTTNFAEAHLTISGTSVSGNDTLGGLDAGGVGSFAGVVTITDSLVANNQGGTAGAGIFGQNTELRIENSTISGNDSPNNTGGAIRLRADRALDPDGVGTSVTEILSSTVAFNNSGVGGAVTSKQEKIQSAILPFRTQSFLTTSGHRISLSLVMVRT